MTSVLGAFANLAMLLAVIYLGILGVGDTRNAALISIIAAGVWFVAGLFYFVVNSRGRSREVWTAKRAETA